MPYDKTLTPELCIGGSSMETDNLAKVTPSLRNLFFELREGIRSLGCVREKICTGRYYCFYSGSKPSTKFVEVEALPTKNCLSIISKIYNNQTYDEGFARPVPESHKWGKYVRFTINESSQLGEAMRLIRDAYNWVIH
jgi:predicted transport protein